MEFINEYIVIVPLLICLCVGYVIKNLIPNETVNHFIPLIVAVLGVVITAWMNSAITPEVVCSGMVSGLASTGLYEAFAQAIKAYNAPKADSK